MKPLDSERVRSRVLGDTELRRQYYESLQQRRRERIEHEQQEAAAEAAKQSRRDALWKRLNYDPTEAERKLKAKIQETESQEREQRLAEWRRDQDFVYAMTTAARRRLKELGIH